MQQVDEAIKRICSEIIVVEQGGVKIEGLKDELLTDEENLLLMELEKDKDLKFKKLQNQARYYYSFRRDMMPIAFTNIYSKLKKEKNETYEKFKELLIKDLEQIKKQKMSRYELYLPINIKTTKKIHKFRFEDIDVDFINDTKIINEIKANKKTQQEFFTNKKFNFSQHILCKVSMRCRNVEYALNKAGKLFEFILGVIGFFETYGINRRTISGIPKPLSELSQSYTFIFQNNKYCTYYYYQNKDEIKKNITLSDGRVKEINKVIKRAIKAKQQELIFKLYASFYRGVTDKSIDYAFLSFWRIIELAIMKEKEQRHSEIINILKALLIELKPRTNYKLDRFYFLRNNFVHNGFADINEFDRNGIKSFAQMIINIYLNTLFDYKTEDIKLFYYYIKRKDNVTNHIKIAKKINKLIIEAKKKNK